MASKVSDDFKLPELQADPVDTITPIQPVTITKEASEEVSPISNKEEENPSLEVKTPVIVFEDPDEKK